MRTLFSGVHVCVEDCSSTTVVCVGCAWAWGASAPGAFVLGLLFLLAFPPLHPPPLNLSCGCMSIHSQQWQEILHGGRILRGVKGAVTQARNRNDRCEGLGCARCFVHALARMHCVLPALLRAHNPTCTAWACRGYALACAKALPRHGAHLLPPALPHRRHPGFRWSRPSLNVAAQATGGIRQEKTTCLGYHGRA